MQCSQGLCIHTCMERTHARAQKHVSTGAEWILGSARFVATNKCWILAMLLFVFLSKNQSCRQRREAQQAQTQTHLTVLQSLLQMKRPAFHRRRKLMMAEGSVPYRT